ncbi:DgyrCDS6512 [Dimorphilus gyrociliatus]|uniref:DgyrCDS6512 n=1 Tax=Dimorphilus gyrociliatus TaxID=2664684 RepID=A0A7I8VQK3_9ANNE|nr:DgyrCDS6512 [Dimorphilus gyrociliatus]
MRMLYILLLLSSLIVVSDGALWSGRKCCELFISKSCRRSCEQAKSRLNIDPKCFRDEDYKPFEDCLKRGEGSKKCCNQRSIRRKCKQICKRTFVTQYPSAEELLQVQSSCEENVSDCVDRFFVNGPKPIQNSNFSACCDEGESVECQLSCRRILSTVNNHELALESISKKCGPSSFDNKLWLCFYKRTAKRRGYQLPIDGALLQCCQKAESKDCLKRCRENYDKNYFNFNEFDSICLHGTELGRCIENVERPCRGGCKKLEFCSNFIGRPDESFQNCSPRGDAAAEQIMRELLSGGNTGKPKKINEAYVNILKGCPYDIQKATVCAMSIKPCKRYSPSEKLCRYDCRRILHECSSRSGEMNIEAMCDLVSPTDPKEPCFSVLKYAKESIFTSSISQYSTFTSVSQPCSERTCSEINEICVLNKRHCRDSNCDKFKCLKSCGVGQSSIIQVPHKSLVSIPDFSSNKDCWRLCSCSKNGRLEDCSEAVCPEVGFCWYNGSSRRHGVSFEDDCRTCVCFDKRVVCTGQTCRNYCPALYNPYCAYKVGRNFVNECYAKKAGFGKNELRRGRCGTKNPCYNAICETVYHSKCMPQRQTCLTEVNCRQHRCEVIDPVTCAQSYKDPVCDTNQRQHNNICRMWEKKAKLSHFGSCHRQCMSNGTVCGQNGETYPSECLAWSFGVAVDYQGSCRVIPFTVEDTGKDRCVDVRCQITDWKNFCQPITLPGLCCPVCGGTITAIYSPTAADKVAQVSGSYLSTFNLTQILRNQLTVDECELFTYISQDNRLVFTVLPVARPLTALRAKACVGQAVMIGSMLSSRHPALYSYAAISIIIQAETKTAQVFESGQANAQSDKYLLALTIILINSLFTVQTVF